MSQTHKDPTVLAGGEPEPAMDETALRILETDVRLATHLRDLSQVSVATLHDIRTPLHTIVLYLELLRNTVGEPESADRSTRQGKYLEVVASELRRLEVMVEGALAQTRLDPAPQRFDLVATTQGMLVFLEPQRRRFHLEVAWEPAPQPVFVRGRKDALQHALIHVLVLSLEAMSEGETLRVGVSERGGRAVVTIVAPAAWYTPGEKERDPAHALLGPERGLEVARRVVEQHHGTIEVRSGASRATTVEIELPLSAAEDR